LYDNYKLFDLVKGQGHIDHILKRDTPPCAITYTINIPRHWT